MSQLLNNLAANREIQPVEVNEGTVSEAFQALGNRQRVQLRALRDSLDRELTRMQAMALSDATILATVRRLQMLQAGISDRLGTVDPLGIVTGANAVDEYTRQPLNTGTRRLSGYMSQEGTGPGLARTAVFGAAAFAFLRPVWFSIKQTIGRIPGFRWLRGKNTADEAATTPSQTTTAPPATTNRRAA